MLLLLFLVQRHFCWRRPSFLLLSSPVNSLVFLIWQSSCSPTLSMFILLNITASSWSFFKWTQQILLLSRQWCQSSVCRVLMTDSCWITSFIDLINIFFLLTNQVINSTPMCVCVCYLQLHVVSQSLHCVHVNSGLTNQKQPSLFSHLPFNPECVRQHRLYTHTHTQ